MIRLLAASFCVADRGVRQPNAPEQIFESRVGAERIRKARRVDILKPNIPGIPSLIVILALFLQPEEPTVFVAEYCVKAGDVPWDIRLLCRDPVLPLLGGLRESRPLSRMIQERRIREAPSELPNRAKVLSIS